MSAYDRLYLHSVVYHSQALFRVMSHKDMDIYDAIRLYMISFQRRLMDEGNPLAINKTPRQLISRMLDGYSLAHVEPKEMDEFILNWMARIYVRLQYETELSSTHIVNVLKPEWLYKHYYPLHEASIECALRKIMDIFFSEKEDSQNGIIGFHDESKSFGFLSNWYLSRFGPLENGNGFTSIEQWLMFRKAKLFGDDAIAQRIMEEIKPSVIKELGRQVKGYDERTWAGVRYRILVEGLKMKFGQSKELKKKLLETGNNTLAEFAQNDTIYGIGVSDKDPNRFDPSCWHGQNILGIALMQVRAELE